MIVQLSSAYQDYIKAIYHLLNRHGEATTSQIANALQVKPASVTGMLRKMAKFEQPLIEYKKHYGVTLTPIGEKVALEMVRHHRLVEQYLHEKLGYSWDEVHEEAEQLEHVISEEMEERIAAVLGHPQRNVHGQPIPDRDLNMAPVTAVPLTQCPLQQPAVIWSVRDEDPALLRYLGELGLRPHTNITLLHITPDKQSFTLQKEGDSTPITINRQTADHISVETNLS